jgi:hypothetical protein
MNGAYKTLISR